MAFMPVQSLPIWKLGVLMLGKQHEWLPTFPADLLSLLMSIFIFISITRLQLLKVHCR